MASIKSILKLGSFAHETSFPFLTFSVLNVVYMFLNVYSNPSTHLLIAQPVLGMCCRAGKQTFVLFQSELHILSKVSLWGELQRIVRALPKNSQGWPDSTDLVTVPLSIGDQVLENFKVKIVFEFVHEI